VGAGPAPARGQESVSDAAEPAAAERSALEARRAELRAAVDRVSGELAALEAELGEVAGRIDGLESTLATLATDRAATVARLEGARAARTQPLELRREIALTVYVSGDPYSASLIDDIATATATMDRVADRELYDSVREWAEAELVRLDTEIAGLESALADLDARIPEAEDRLAAERAARSDALDRRDALGAELAELERELRSLLVAPLTGLPADPPSDRPVLIVKIDNAPPARPQAGLAAADVVVEERVEGGISRFAVLFQSAGADPVGPIRSARTSDVHLFANLGRPLFAYSGANLGVGGAVAASNLVDVGATRVDGPYYRERTRRAPHNLYADTTSLWSSAFAGSPVPMFRFRPEGAGLPARARPATGVDLTYGTTDASFTWNPDLAGWVRSTDGRPHTDASGAPLAPANVVVRFVEYRPSPADPRSPEAVVTGSGPVWILTAGHVVEGTWQQPSPTEPTRYLGPDGVEIELTPGRTWVVLPSPGQAGLR
jgi:predicted  nucleic acid-binding Zn-ribbon protein